MVFLVYWLYHATKLRRNIAMDMQQRQLELAGPLPALAPSGRLRGRVCLVVGATSGIGRATALRMAEEGAAAVVVTGRRRELGLQLEQEIRQRGGRRPFPGLRCNAAGGHGGGGGAGRGALRAAGRGLQQCGLPGAACRAGRAG
ncbi:SDR family NAD(P)-dependent oxidoreductase [Delftia acidovorans]|uniref:SDR family NAD(P)-dependent oxidoreductase n=1 Tax=Delftia acidovorans TaxID=80866 RepID=UPI00359FD507